MKRWYSTSEAASYLTISRSKFYEIRDQIPHSQVGERRVYDLHDLDAYVESRKQSPGLDQARFGSVSVQDILRSLEENYDPASVVFDARLSQTDPQNLQKNDEQHGN